MHWTRHAFIAFSFNTLSRPVDFVFSLNNTVTEKSESEISSIVNGTSRLPTIIDVPIFPT